jgi:hypothetical protein
LLNKIGASLHTTDSVCSPQKELPPQLIRR